LTSWFIGEVKSLYEHSQIPRATIQAYLETEYRVYGSLPTVLRIGQPNQTLCEIHSAYGVLSSAFVTACNPFSRALDVSANASRQVALATELTRRGFQFIDGIGEHPSNGWPGEPSFLVLAASFEDASALGRLFEQNAMVWSDGKGLPQLVLLR
jgi:Protein of unknown function (DUF3293)